MRAFVPALGVGGLLYAAARFTGLDRSSTYPVQPDGELV
jgi:hypothetical protein